MAAKHDEITKSDSSDSVEGMYPTRPAAVETQEVADEMVLFDAERNRAFSLNTSARAIWELCDGKTSVAEIKATLANWVDRLPEEIGQDVEAAIADLVDLGVLRLAQDARSDHE